MRIGAERGPCGSVASTLVVDVIVVVVVLALACCSTTTTLVVVVALVIGYLAGEAGRLFQTIRVDMVILCFVTWWVVITRIDGSMDRFSWIFSDWILRIGLIVAFEVAIGGDAWEQGTVQEDMCIYSIVAT